MAKGNLVHIIGNWTCMPIRKGKVDKGLQINKYLKLTFT